LLTNAAKYTPAGGLIEVSGRASCERVELAVRDTGVGIDSELLPHVFDLFVQGRQSIHRSKGGLGVGLPIGRTLPEMHGGSVRGAPDRPSARDAAVRFKPDVALLDIRLQVMDGYELAGHLATAQPELKLIAITGYGQETDRERSRAAGFSEHLVKPIDFMRLI